MLFLLFLALTIFLSTQGEERTTVSGGFGTRLSVTSVCRLPKGHSRNNEKMLGMAVRSFFYSLVHLISYRLPFLFFCLNFDVSILAFTVFCVIRKSNTFCWDFYQPQRHLDLIRVFELDYVFHNTFETFILFSIHCLFF